MNARHVCIDTPLYVEDWNYDFVIFCGYSFEYSVGMSKSAKPISTKGYAYVPISHPALCIPSIVDGYMHPMWNPEYPLTYHPNLNCYKDRHGQECRLVIHDDFQNTGKYKLIYGTFTKEFWSKPMGVYGLATVFKIFKKLEAKSIWGEYFGCINKYELILSQGFVVVTDANLIK